MEKIDWMLGMTQNMMNITEKNMEMPMMKEMYSMTSTMMGNLNYMKVHGSENMNMIDMMEQMMKGMEGVMTNMDINDEKMNMMMKNMMSFMVSMQMTMMMEMK